MRKILLFLMLIIASFCVESRAAFAEEIGSSGWIQFPSNDSVSEEISDVGLSSSARLALTAAGPNVSMTYTPATYKLQKLSDVEAMYLQVHDAPLSSLSRHDVGSGGIMALLFYSDDDEEQWSVHCGGNLVADPSSPMLSIASEDCGFRVNNWSRSLKITPGGGDHLYVKTIWSKSSAEYSYGDQPQGHQDMINVFRLQSWRGAVQLAPTNPEHIQHADGRALDFTTHEVKSDYEASINWVVAYKTQQEAFFSFEVDVSSIQGDYLYLWDKDADANRLFLEKDKVVAAQPPDDGISMVVRWSDGSPLRYDGGTFSQGIPITQDPEWTLFDQTNREEFLPTWDDGSHTNRFDGPSWDSGADPQGYDALRWYKIPIFDRLSDSVVIGWFGSTVPQNTFAFAASGPISPAPCAKLESCKEVFEALEGPLPSVEEYKIPQHCVLSKHLKTCISSSPVADPDPESFGLIPGDPEKGVIYYNLIFENINDDTEKLIENVSVLFEPPHNTSLLDSLIPYAIPVDGSDNSDGKSTVQIDGPSMLTPGQVFSQDLGVRVDEDGQGADYDISSSGAILVEAKDIPPSTLPGLVHHVGEGGENISATRCYAFDYVGGEFSCSESCANVPPGTIITVRDRLENHGGSAVENYRYSSSGLHDAFEYVSESIRFDDPQFGIGYESDGALFPSEIVVPGILSSAGKRDVFFRYLVPEEALDAEARCFEPTPTSDDQLHLDYKPECTSAASAQEGVICVGNDGDPQLLVELAAIPGDGKTVYQGSSVSYQLTITNTSKQAVEYLDINSLLPEQSHCIDGPCSGLELSNPLELQDQFGSMSILFTVQINEDAQGTAFTHQGVTLEYTGTNGNVLSISSNPIEHMLLSIPEPTGAFQHHINLSRRTVINAAEDNQSRSDQADITEITHQFEYEGTQKDSVWPELNGQLYNFHNVCNFLFPSYESYDAEFNSYSYVYNSSRRRALSGFRQISSNDADFRITTTAPSERPELLVAPDGGHQHQFTYTFDGARRDGMGLNGFMKNGGVIESSQLETTVLRSIKDGMAGKIRTENVVLSNVGSGRIREDLWKYVRVGTRRDRNRCMFCTNKGCRFYDARVPLYKWKVVSSRMIPLQAEDSDYVSSLTSVAWLQTKNGHIGFGTPFWAASPNNNDPNVVHLDDAKVATLMKFYTPPDQSNADLFVFSPGDDPLRSGLGKKGRVDNAQVEQGYIPSPTAEGERQLSRGNAYDRQENPRSYFDDLINRELYGRVVRLNSVSTFPAGMRREGTELVLNGRVIFEPDLVYYWQGSARIGESQGSEVIIDGGKSRLVIDGTAQIANNVRYAASWSNDFANIPSLRLHVRNDLYIHPSVTDVELMMLVEQDFHSGRNDQQLRILGDVIAFRAFWERSPLHAHRENEELVNKPSELVVEDYRKYLLTPPGDKKLPDEGNVWRDVNPATGKPLLEWLYEELR